MVKYLSLALFSFALLKPLHAEVGATLVVDAQTGEVLHSENAGVSWFPASLTKMMTAYVTLKAIEEKRFTLHHAMRVSPLAAKQAPSKMGFKPGSTLTVETALKIIMVKSANDVSLTIAEAVSGSLPAFVREMNIHADHLGMSGTVFTNANGLPSSLQRTSARDMAILARALLIEFPDHRELWDIPALNYQGKIIRNTNHLIGRFPGMMGMKTGFICASGFNVVAAASRNGRVLITVVMGAHSARQRAEIAASLFEKHFASRGRLPLASIQNVGGSPQSIAAEVCKRRAKGQPPVAESAEYYDNEPLGAEDPQSSQAFFLQEALRKEAAMNRPLRQYNPERLPEMIALGGNAQTPSQVLGVVTVAKQKPVVAAKKDSVKKIVVAKKKSSS